MNLEEEIFKRYNPDYKKLIDYGFNKNKDEYKIEKLFLNGKFRAIISINSDGKIEGKVFDEDSKDEFLPLRVENATGEFVGKVREEYEKVLNKIKNNCFYKKYFIYPQSNRITDLILKKYKNEPEFLWEKFDGSAIFRNPNSKKWYAIIMDVDRSKIQKNKSGLTEVINLKLSKENIEKMLKQPDFYPAYHMNKKHWITIILDDSVNDEKIMDLLEESYNFSITKN